MSRANNQESLEVRFVCWQFKKSGTQRAVFFELMASLIRDGKALDASLRQLADRYTKKKRPLAPVMLLLVNSLSEGKTFAQASKNLVSDTESIILAAGERSGDLGAAFDQAALVARAGVEISSAVWKEMATPVLQVTILVFLMVGFSTTVAPELSKSVPKSALDDSQRMLFGLAEIVAQTWFFAVPVMAAAVWACLWSLSQYTGPARKYLDKIPPWSVYRTYSGSTFMIALSALIRAGVPIEAAIRFIRDQASPWMKIHLGEMISRLRSGAAQGDAIDVGLLTDDLADTVAIYSQTADFDQAISSLGKEAVKLGIKDITSKAGRAKIISTLLIGFFVGWMFDAMMSIGDAAQRASKQQDGRASSQQVGRP